MVPLCPRTILPPSSSKSGIDSRPTEQLASSATHAIWLTSSQIELTHNAPKPGYFRFLTLVAFHAFTALKVWSGLNTNSATDSPNLQVDATILEVGIGGLNDSTNIVPRPRVTGITSLGLDHIRVLGPTLRDIAYQKGGIYKVRVL